ncbi:MAG TPA: hypothetical protein ENJ56_02645 [Anaerolineae bacterium]|nr:hypothetical protein [Anaerolineae bacterium]
MSDDTDKEESQVAKKIAELLSFFFYQQFVDVLALRITRKQLWSFVSLRDYDYSPLTAARKTF